MTATDLSGTVIYELIQGATHKYKQLIVETPETAVSADYFDIDLTKYAGSKLKSIYGAVASTVGSIVATEAPTTAVTNGVLRVTIGGTAVTKSRVYTIIFA